MKHIHALFPTLLLWTATVQAQTAFQRVIELPTDTINTDLYRPISTSDGGYMFFLRQDTVRALVKLDQNGDLLWSKAYPVVAGEPWFVFGLVPTTDGGAVMLLESASDLGWGVGVYHVRLARVDAGGTLIWTKRYNLPIDESSVSITAELVTNGANEFFVRAAPSQPSSDPIRIIKINGSGDVLWCSALVTFLGEPHVRSLYPALGGGCLTVMWSDAFNDAPNEVVLLDGSGNTVWHRSIRMTNGAWMFAAGAAIQASTGQVYLLGFQMSMGPGPSFGYLVRIALNGDLDWYKIYGDGTYMHYADEAAELPSGDLRFGDSDVNVFDADGNHLSHQQRSFPPIDMGLLSYQFEGGKEIALSSSEAFMKVTNWAKHDDFFGYSWYQPVVSVVPWDLNNICGWDSTTISAVSDTIVPPAYIEYLTLPNSTPSSYTYDDTATVSVDVPLTLIDFCPLLGVADVPTHNNQLQVFPSLLQAGALITVRAQNATRIELIDARGRLLHAFRPQGDVVINSSELQLGLYLIRALDAGGMPLGAARVVLE